MSTVNLTTDSFEQTVTGNDIVLVDWWAAWCGPCKMFAPVYDKAAGTHPDVVFGKVDTEDQQALADWLRENEVETILGPLSWDETGAPTGEFLIGQWQGGEAQIVLPEDAATAEIAPSWSPGGAG